MKLKLQLDINDGHWYYLEKNSAVCVCHKGLVEHGLLACDSYPREIELTLVLKNPKRAGFERIDFMSMDECYFIIHKRTHQMGTHQMAALAYGTSCWISENVALDGRACSVWVRVDKETL